MPNNLTTQAPSAVLKPAHEVSSAVASRPSATDVKSSGRMELPEVIVSYGLWLISYLFITCEFVVNSVFFQDLFTVSYPAFRAPVPGWQTGQPGSMGFPMQYNTTVVYS